MITKSRQRHVIGYATSTWLAAPPTLPGTVRVSMSLEDLAWLHLHRPPGRVRHRRSCEMEMTALRACLLSLAAWAVIVAAAVLLAYCAEIS